jgi:hypothetical protein
VEKKYIRLDRLADPADAFNGHHTPFTRGFGDLLLYELAWTDDPSGVLNRCHSEWAGHRFDVTVLEEVEADSGALWEDVSHTYEYIKEEMPELLKASSEQKASYEAKKIRGGRPRCR